MLWQICYNMLCFFSNFSGLVFSRGKAGRAQFYYYSHYYCCTVVLLSVVVLYRQPIYKAQHPCAMGRLFSFSLYDSCKCRPAGLLTAILQSERLNGMELSYCTLLGYCGLPGVARVQGTHLRIHRRRVEASRSLTGKILASILLSYNYR